MNRNVRRAMKVFVAAVLVVTLGGSLLAADPAKPTWVDVAYGPHERNVLDLWQASSDKPTPLIVFIHGGGFSRGDKSSIRGKQAIQQCLDAGVSFAAINWEFRRIFDGSPRKTPICRECRRFCSGFQDA